MHSSQRVRPVRGVSRRRFLAGGAAALTGAAASDALAALPVSSERPLARIGIVTDVHYADKDTAGTRHYRESLDKLSEAVEAFNRRGVDAAVEMGDWIDGGHSVGGTSDSANLAAVNTVFRRANARRAWVLGNHCVQGFGKDEFLSRCGQARAYFSFDINGVHAVVLDACNRADGMPYHRGNFDWKDCSVPATEQEWLRRDLQAARGPAVVFVHQRLDVEPGDAHGPADSPEVRRILERSGKVAGVFQGHAHLNDLRVIKGIPYCTLAAMVEGSGPENSGYSILSIYADGEVTLDGFRNHAVHPLSGKRFPRDV